MDGNNPFSSYPSSRERECGHFDESRTGPLAQHGREFPTRLPVMLTKPSDAKALLPGPESQLHVAFCCHNQFHGMWSIRTLVFYPLWWYPSLPQVRLRQRLASTPEEGERWAKGLHDTHDCLLAEREHQTVLFVLLLVAVHGKDFSFCIPALFEAMMELYTFLSKYFRDK